MLSPLSISISKMKYCIDIILCLSIHNSKLADFEKQMLVVEVTNTNCIINVTDNRLTLSNTKSSLDFRTGRDNITFTEFTTIH